MDAESVDDKDGMIRVYQKLRIRDEHFLTVTRHFGPRTLRPQDTSAPVPKCPGHFGTGAEVYRDTSAPVPKCLELRHRFQ